MADGKNLIGGDSSKFWSVNFYGGNKKGSGSFSEQENGKEMPCIKISCFGKGVSGQAISIQKFPVAPADKLKFKFMVKSSFKRASAQLRFFSEDNKMTGRYVLNLNIEPDIWQDAGKAKRNVCFFGLDKDGKPAKRVTASFNNPKEYIVPAKSKYLRVYLFNQGVGSTFFKEVSLINPSAKKIANGEKKNARSVIKDKDLEEEAKRLLIGKNKSFKKDIEEFTGKRLKLEIEDVKLSTDYKMTDEKFPEKATNIRVSGPNITRNGKPVFLFGLESSPEVFPWWNRALGIDFIHLADPYVMATMKYKMNKETCKIWWEPYKWMEVQIRELLRNGLAVYVQPVEGGSVYMEGRSKISRELKKHGAITNTCHFLGFRPDNPIGMRLKQNFWKSILKSTRKYPIFMYELYNEVRYSDYSPANIALFRESMRDKYKMIDEANKSWGTHFENFAAVMPPIKGLSYANVEFQVSPDNFSRMLWRDWGVFMEKQFGKHLLEMRHFIQKYERNPYSYLTVQSFFDMPMGYVSLGGDYPEEVMKSEDIFGMELGASYRDQFEGEENIYEIKQMLKPSFIRNCVANISSGKPVMGEECKPQKACKIADPDKSLIKLSGKWKFNEDNDNRGVDKKFDTLTFDDSTWPEVNMPGMWGRQGFKDCVTGWCRKEFIAPENLKGKKVFLNGKELADKSKIYLNGVLIKETTHWNEEFSVDIAKQLKYAEKNTLAIQITCGYKTNGFYWGGIRNFIAINNVPFFETPKLTSGEMRSFLWGQVIDGFSGVIMSYAYGADFQRLSMFRPDRYSYECTRAIPKIKKEIDSLAEIVLPRPRLKSKTAMLYPFETGRAHVYKERGKFHEAPLLLDILAFYCSALFKQLDVDVINNDLLLRNGLGKYQMFILTGCPRVQKGTVEKLEEFVNNGGTLIVNHDSLKIEDGFNKPIQIPEFLGIKSLLPLKKEEAVNSDEFGINGKTGKSEFKASFGEKIIPEKAKVIAKYADGSAAITLNEQGKGKVYYFGCQLEYNDLKRAIAKISEENKIEKSLEISSDKKAEFIEAHALGRKGKYVWYIFNWGGGEKDLTVSWKNIQEGSYKIVDIVKNSTVAEKISSNSIREGVKVNLKSHDPVILLLENLDLPATKIQTLTQKEQKMIGLWRPSPKAETPVLLCTMNEFVSKSKILTSLNMLEHFGYEFHFGMNEINDKMETYNESQKKKSISEYKILVSLGNKYPRKLEKTEKALKKFLAQGGGVLLSANHYVGPHGWLSNRRIQGLVKPFGIEYTNTNMTDEKNNVRVADFPTFTDIETNEITQGVKTFQSRGMSILKVENPDAQILIKAGKDSNQPGAPIMVALERENGRVVIMGDAKWMQPDWICKGDNAQLLMNIFNWLAKKPIKIYNREELEKLLEYKFE
jgi:beta-galactosidase GanA